MAEASTDHLSGQMDILRFSIQEFRDNLSGAIWPTLLLCGAKINILNTLAKASISVIEGPGILYSIYVNWLYLLKYGAQVFDIFYLLKYWLKVFDMFYLLKYGAKVFDIWVICSNGFCHPLAPVISIYNIHL